MTGDAKEEYINIMDAKKNLEINFTHPTLILNQLSKKMIKKSNSFIAVVTSVADYVVEKNNYFILLVALA